MTNKKLLVFAHLSQFPAQFNNWAFKNDIEVVFSGSNKAVFGEAEAHGSTHVVIDWDTHCPIGGLDALKAAARALPDVHITILTANENPGMTASLANYSADVLIKHVPVGTLTRAIVKPGHDPVILTAREKEVLSLLCFGYKNNRIGDDLQIATKTVEAHRTRIFKKLGAANVADCVVLALRSGLVAL